MYAFIADIPGEKPPTGKEGDEEENSAGEYGKGCGKANRFDLCSRSYFRF
jgi:hypothetical protein